MLRRRRGWRRKPCGLLGFLSGTALDPDGISIDAVGSRSPHLDGPKLHDPVLPQRARTHGRFYGELYPERFSADDDSGEHHPQRRQLDDPANDEPRPQSGDRAASAGRAAGSGSEKTEAAASAARAVNARRPVRSLSPLAGRGEKESMDRYYFVTPCRRSCRVRNGAPPASPETGSRSKSARRWYRLRAAGRCRR